MRLRCRGLVARPGGAAVLRGLDLDVAAGTRTALVGPSGAGKTTLLRAICGLQDLHAGEIALGDRAIDALPPHRRRCAVVFQEPRLLPHLDVLDNVAFALRAAKVPRTRRRAVARELLDEVGLAGEHGRRVDGLSGGEQQRVALARALCAEPELLMLDEPLAAVDPERRAELRALVVALQERRGVTTLVITHDRHEAAELGQHVALLLDGTIVQDDVPEAVFERPASVAAARFVGAEVLRGTVRDGALVVGEGRLPVPGPDGVAAFAVRPERVEVDGDGPLRMTLTEAVYAGGHVRLVLRSGTTTLRATCPPGAAPAAGRVVGVRIATGALWRLPADDEVGPAGPGDPSGGDPSPAGPPTR